MWWAKAESTSNDSASVPTRGVDLALLALPITCYHNPEAACESILGDLVPARKPRRILVVGGGPAGLKAAEIAARRGHGVTAVERSAALVGKLRAAAVLPAAAELFHAVEWVVQQLDQFGVTTQLGTVVDEASIADHDSDEVVLATGSRFEPERVLGDASDGSVPVISTEEAMATGQRRMSSSWIDSAPHGAVRAAERLASCGSTVDRVSPLPRVGRHLGATHGFEIVLHLLAAGCRVEPNVDAVALGGGAVRLRHTLTGETTERNYALVRGAVERPAGRAARGPYGPG